MVSSTFQLTLRKDSKKPKQSRLLKVVADDHIEAESFVDDILKEKFQPAVPERKLLVKFSEQPRYNAMKETKPRKNMEIADTVPYMKSYHPITLAFIGTYDMKVEKDQP